MFAHLHIHQNIFCSSYYKPLKNILKSISHYATKLKKKHKTEMKVPFGAKYGFQNTFL